MSQVRTQTGKPFDRNWHCEPPARSTGSMHQNVPVWSDPCCCCEAEPYWREVAAELGIDVDGDEL